MNQTPPSSPAYPDDAPEPDARDTEHAASASSGEHRPPADDARRPRARSRTRAGCTVECRARGGRARASGEERRGGPAPPRRHTTAAADLRRAAIPPPGPRRIAAAGAGEPALRAAPATASGATRLSAAPPRASARAARRDERAAAPLRGGPLRPTAAHPALRPDGPPERMVIREHEDGAAGHRRAATGRATRATPRTRRCSV